MSIERPVLVFDSGSGGLSVWQEIVRLRQDVSSVYCADFEGFPYGTKADWQVAERVTGLLQRLLPRYRPALVVLACNTASTLLLDDLRQRFELPFVGVVPAIKTAATASGVRRICLLATPATINRPYIDQLVRDFAPGHEVVMLGQGDLVRIAEEVIRGHPLDSTFGAVIESIRGLDVDSVVLGCTHFPLLRDQFEKHLPAVKWIDSGHAIARRVSHLLGPSVRGNGVGWHEAVYSGSRDLAWESGVSALGFNQVAVLPSGCLAE